MVFFRIEFLNFPTAKYQKEGSCQSVDPGRNVKHDLPSEKYLLFKFNSVKNPADHLSIKVSRSEGDPTRLSFTASKRSPQ